MKKEKNMKKIIGIALTLFIMVSCSKDFIDLNPVSSVNVDVLYKTDKDFKDALTAIYNTYQSQYQTFYIFGDIRADDAQQEIYKTNSQSYSDAFVTTSSDGLMNSTWQNYYRIIYRANMILLKIDAVDAAVVGNKDRYIAEAKFLRALAYFDLVRTFGDVPLVTKPLSIEEGYLAVREKVATIYNNLIIPDLLAAEAVLPLSYAAADFGRPTKGAARSILGRVYMTVGDFQKAEAKLMEVTSMSYALLPNFNNLFTYTNERHSEYIFDIEYEEGMGEGSSFSNRFLPNSSSMAKFYGVVGNGDEQNSPTDILINLYQPGDLRKDITVGFKGGYYGAGGAWITLPANTSQTYTMKYLIPEPAASDSKANWKVIRYADVLLMLAEALNENGKTGEAIPYLNQIRTRAGVETYPLTLSQAETRDAIALERRLELSFEGVRWFDLLRTGKALETMAFRGMQPYMTVFPLPLSQVQLINDASIFPQNEGYN
jgi:starch-binding outer membrane protein, SusD/RagB family